MVETVEIRSATRVAAAYKAVGRACPAVEKVSINTKSQSSNMRPVK